MINARKLKRPTKKSGRKLLPGEMVLVRGLEIKNVSSEVVYIDRFTPWFQTAKGKAKRKAKAKIKARMKK